MREREREREREVVEQIREVLPHVGAAVLAVALVIKAVAETHQRMPGA
jgi:hypothetical protein